MWGTHDTSTTLFRVITCYAPKIGQPTRCGLKSTSSYTRFSKANLDAHDVIFLGSNY